MFHPTREGCRGGRDKFKWEDIKTDKHRQNYLGNSLKAPHSRYTKNHCWYNRTDDEVGGKDLSVKDEAKKIKMKEDILMKFYLENGKDAKIPADLFKEFEEYEDEAEENVTVNKKSPSTPKVPLKRSGFPLKSRSKSPPQTRLRHR